MEQADSLFERKDWRQLYLTLQQDWSLRLGMEQGNAIKTFLQMFKFQIKVYLGFFNILF